MVLDFGCFEIVNNRFHRHAKRGFFVPKQVFSGKQHLTAHRKPWFLIQNHVFSAACTSQKKLVFGTSDHASIKWADAEMTFSLL